MKHPLVSRGKISCLTNEVLVNRPPVNYIDGEVHTDQIIEAVSSIIYFE